MAYTPSNKRAKNCCKRTIQVQVIIEDVVAVFFGTQCISDLLVFIHFTPQDKNFVSESYQIIYRSGTCTNSELHTTNGARETNAL